MFSNEVDADLGNFTTEKEVQKEKPKEVKKRADPASSYPLRLPSRCYAGVASLLSSLARALDCLFVVRGSTLTFSQKPRQKTIRETLGN